VQLICGDFNMALFTVVPELRMRGLNIDLAASYFWVGLNNDLKADSCGIFVLGATKLRRVFNSCAELEDAHKKFLGPDLAESHPTFPAPKRPQAAKAMAQGSRASGSASSRSKQSSEPIPEEAAMAQGSRASGSVSSQGNQGSAAVPEVTQPSEAEEPKLPKGHQPKKEHPKLHRFADNSAGFPLESYMCGDSASIMDAMDFSWTKDLPLPDTAAKMPPVLESRVATWIFDPTHALFKGGAHMPLLIQIGTKGGRTEEKLIRRELIRRAKRNSVKEFGEAKEELERTTGEGASGSRARSRSQGKKGPRADPAEAAALRPKAKEPEPYDGPASPGLPGHAASAPWQPTAAGWADSSWGSSTWQTGTGSSWQTPPGKGGSWNRRGSSTAWGGSSSSSKNAPWHANQWRGQ